MTYFPLCLLTSNNFSVLYISKIVLSFLNLTDKLLHAINIQPYV